MLESIVWLAAVVIFAWLSVRFGADSRELEKTLNTMEPVRPQI